jgi:hypothetical protein
MLGPPFRVAPLADVGSSEPFLARISIGLIDVLNATLYDNRNEIKNAIMGLSIDCLIPAFMSLRELRKIADDDKAPLLSKNKAFDDLCKYVWTAYKDRMTKTARLMGYEIGFLFQKDSFFEAGCETFLKNNPEVGPLIIPLMKHNRSSWQADLSKFRNDYLEHQTIKRHDVASFYSLTQAETWFQNVWIAIEEILVSCLSAKLPTMCCLREIPESERPPELPKRYGFALRQR